MKTEDLKAKGLTDEQIAFVMAENGKDLKKLQTDNDRLTTERDGLKQRAESAEETLKKFDGIDADAMKAEVETWKQKAADAEKDYNAKIAERDFNDALKTEIEGFEFTSEAAKRAVIADIRAAGLKLKDGKILGLNDLITQMKEKDASAFVDEQQQGLEHNKARFTQPLNRNTTQTTGGKTKDDIMKIKDPAERQRMIAQNMDLF